MSDISQLIHFTSKLRKSGTANITAEPQCQQSQACGYNATCATYRQQVGLHCCMSSRAEPLVSLEREGREFNKMQTQNYS